MKKKPRYPQSEQEIIESILKKLPSDVDAFFTIGSPLLKSLQTQTPSFSTAPSCNIPLANVKPAVPLVLDSHKTIYIELNNANIPYDLLSSIDFQRSSIKIIHVAINIYELFDGVPTLRNARKRLKEEDFFAVGYTNKNNLSGHMIFIHKSILPNTSLKSLQRYCIPEDTFFDNTRKTCIRIIKKPVRRAKIWASLLHSNRWHTIVAVKKIIVDNPKPDSIEIDVIITLIPKDIAIARHAIASIRKQIAHTIKNIFIIAPHNPLILDLCAQNNCIFTDETKVLPITKDSINYTVNNQNRAGWLFQQLLKLNCETISCSQYILVADADTLLVRPKKFIVNNKIVFDVSDEFHAPYYKTLKKLLPIDQTYPLSFVAHHMLFERNSLQELKLLIAKTTRQTWYEAIISLIDKNETSYFSEFETYGNFMLRFHPDTIIFQYWYNCSKDISQFEKCMKDFPVLSTKFSALSFHAYNH